MRKKGNEDKKEKRNKPIQTLITMYNRKSFYLNTFIKTNCSFVFQQSI